MCWRSVFEGDHQTLSSYVEDTCPQSRVGWAFNALSPSKSSAELSRSRTSVRVKNAKTNETHRALTCGYSGKHKAGSIHGCNYYSLENTDA